MADRNPFMLSPDGKVEPGVDFIYNGTREEQEAGNSFIHKKKGQNVLYLNGKTDFQRRSFCGLNEDNIYTHWGIGTVGIGGQPLPTFQQRMQGTAPSIADSYSPTNLQPKNDEDAMLVSDNASMFEPWPK